MKRTSFILSYIWVVVSILFLLFVTDHYLDKFQAIESRLKKLEDKQ